MEEKKINKSIAFSIVAVLLLVIVVAGSTYAYFRAAGETDVQEITTANLKMAFDDSTEIINAELSPITTDEVLTKAAKKTFRIAKDANSQDLYVKIKLSDLTIPEELAQYDLKWALYQGTTPVTTGDFGGKTSGEIIIATNQFINVIDDPEVEKDGVEYNLYIWINETNLDQGIMMGQTMTARVTATGQSSKENTLASVLLGENNTNVEAGEFNFANDFTCDLDEAGEGPCTGIYQPGLYSESGDVTKTEMGFSTYYFRGNVTNNYVKFGTYKTNDGRNTIGNDIIWRVVRINEDGSVKLISEEMIVYPQLWNTSENPVIDYKESDIFRLITAWYDNNILVDSSLDKNVVTSNFCVDISGNYTGAKERLDNNNPTFVCPSGAYNDYRKIGLLTADEAVFSGALRQNNVSGVISYLKGTYLLTPGNETSTLKYSDATGVNRITRSELTGNEKARVVINLSPDAIISSGDGLSAETAYVIQ